MNRRRFFKTLLLGGAACLLPRTQTAHDRSQSRIGRVCANQPPIGSSRMDWEIRVNGIKADDIIIDADDVEGWYRVWVKTGEPHEVTFHGHTWVDTPHRVETIYSDSLRIVYTGDHPAYIKYRA